MVVMTVTQASEETVAERCLKALELQAERDEMAFRDLSLCSRVVVYCRNGGFRYYDVELGDGRASGGVVSRTAALKLLEAS